jgi:hypothetical protein
MTKKHASNLRGRRDGPHTLQGELAVMNRSMKQISNAGMRLKRRREGDNG